MAGMNIPVDEVLKAAATKPYGFMPFHPNVGIGGHCIPVDPIYLQAKANELGLESRYIALSEQDRKSTRLNSSHVSESRMPSSA